VVRYRTDRALCAVDKLAYAGNKRYIALAGDFGWLQFFYNDETKIMTRLFLTLVLVCAFDLTFGQKVIDNIKTDEHKQVSGTKFFVIPPNGFIPAATFQGFQQTNTGASILITEIPGAFAESTKGFNEQGLKTQGVILKNKENIKVNGNEGLFLTTTQTAYGTTFSKYILVFGDNNTTYMINGMFPEESTELDKDVRACMFSVVYDAALTVDPLAAVSFKVDTENTKLKLGKAVSGMLLYTVDGKVPTESSDKTSFIAGRSLANVQAIDKKQTAINRIRKLPYTDLKIDEDQTIEIQLDGISGYEIVGEGLDKPNGAKELVYQLMLFTDNGYYIMVGTTKNDFSTNLELFKKVARTFKRK
jgi:hypothetical protein